MPGAIFTQLRVSAGRSIYNVATGGATLYTGTQTVTVTSGVFNVIVGSVTPMSPPPG